jgi:hypothetical protein
MGLREVTGEGDWSLSLVRERTFGLNEALEAGEKLNTSSFTHRVNEFLWAKAPSADKPSRLSLSRPIHAPFSLKFFSIKLINIATYLYRLTNRRLGHGRP